MRNSREGKLGGVCSGIADYFDIDPILVRIGVVVAAFTTGVVVPGYFVAWWLLPDAGHRDGRDPDDDELVYDDRVRRSPHRPPHRHHHGCAHRSFRLPFGPWTIVALFLLVPVGFRVFDALSWWDDGVFVPLVLVATGVAILWFGSHPRTPVAAAKTGPPASVVGSEPVHETGLDAVDDAVDDEDEDPILAEARRLDAQMADPTLDPLYEPLLATPAPPAPLSPRRSRPARWLVPTTMGTLLVGAGAVGLLLAIGIDPGVPTMLSVALLLVGGAMVAGSFVGRGRGLIVPGLVLLAALSITVAGDVPFTGGVGDRHYTAEDLDGSPLRLAMGEMVVDLTGLEIEEGHTAELVATVGIGHLRVVVPAGLAVEVRGEVGLGQVVLFDEDAGGFGAELDVDARNPDLVLELGANVGQVEVVERAA
jgi:phage shock protein PspC (stress-responsive transcriptional regulator)